MSDSTDAWNKSVVKAEVDISVVKIELEVPEKPPPVPRRKDKNGQGKGTCSFSPFKKEKEKGHVVQFNYVCPHKHICRELRSGAKVKVAVLGSHP